MFVVLILGLAGCSSGCPNEPPKKATISPGQLMQYHITLYAPYGQLSHSGAGCTQYEYLIIHIYTDRLGTMRGDEALWRYENGDELNLSEVGENAHNVQLNISQSSVDVSGFRATFERENGHYPVQ